MRTRYISPYGGDMPQAELVIEDEEVARKSNGFIYIYDLDNPTTISKAIYYVSKLHGYNVGYIAKVIANDAGLKKTDLLEDAERWAINEVRKMFLWPK